MNSVHDHEHSMLIEHYRLSYGAQDIVQVVFLIEAFISDESIGIAHRTS